MSPEEFARVGELFRAFTPRNEILLEEVPAPQKLASFALAFSADVSNGLDGDEEDEIASGRFVLLHEPGGQDTWEGEFRCVTFVRADVDPTMQEDPLLPDHGWKWLIASLESAGCTYNAASGTVTRVVNASFGKLSGKSGEAEMEIRASWSPVMKNAEDLITHIQAWCNLLTEVALITLTPEGVSALPRSRK